MSQSRDAELAAFIRSAYADALHCGIREICRVSLDRLAFVETLPDDIPPLTDVRTRD